MDDARTVQWRRDASTSRTVRACWALGVGTFFAMIGLVMGWRFAEAAIELGYHEPLFGLYEAAVAAVGAPVVVAAVGAAVATLLAYAVGGNTGALLGRLLGPLPVSTPSGERLQRAADIVAGTVVMGMVIASLMVVGRIVSQRELLEVGAGPFTGLAAATLPLAFVAIILASFLRSVGAFDPGEGMLYLYEPEEAVDLEVIEGASVRTVGDVAILRLSYAQPDGQYVAGPRRLVVPPAVAREVRARVGPRNRPTADGYAESHGG